jgi:DNA-binding transcriptional regulator YhcF (GntR family)
VDKKFNFISIDGSSSTPKYLQIANSISKAMIGGLILVNDPLPSLNELTCHFDISRDTVEKSYRYLRQKGVLSSFPGKGYFIKENVDISEKPRIFLLFNKLSEQKKIIYDAFVLELGNENIVEFYSYNNDFSTFKHLLRYRKEYAYYVIIPHFRQVEKCSDFIMNFIPKDKLIVLGKKLTATEDQYGSVCENFEYDIYKALVQALPELKRYDTIKIVFAENCSLPAEILVGFANFCTHHNFVHQIVADFTSNRITEGEVYITLTEEDLVYFIECVMNSTLILGKDIGVISYNETPLKKLIFNGITTISTDFKLTGTLAAKQIKTNSKTHIEVPFYLTLRSSL